MTKTGWNIFGGIVHDIQQGLSTAYHATEHGLYDLARDSETAGYEVASELKRGHFVPLREAYKEVGKIHENVPLIGNVSGKQFARIGASYGTQSLPVVGTFGHLASHINENAFQKASDIAFGIADVIPFAGDALSAFKKPAEEGISGIAHIINNNLRTIISPIRTGNEIGDVFANKVLKTGLRRSINTMIRTPLPIDHFPIVKLPIEKAPYIKPRTFQIEPPKLPINYQELRLPIIKTPLPTIITRRIENFTKSVSKDIKLMIPVDRLPRISGVLNDIAKSVRGDLKVVGVGADEDPVHIIAHDPEGILHDIAITDHGKILHYVEVPGGGVKKIGEDAISGGEDLFKAIRKELDNVTPFRIRLANFFRSGKLLAGLAGLGIGLSVAGGLTTSNTTNASTTMQSTGGYYGGTGTGGTGTGGTGTGGTGTGGTGTGGTGTGGTGTGGIGTGGIGTGGTTGSVQGQMNAGNVLQNQLQSLSSQSESSQNSESSQSESNAPSSQKSSIFSNKLLLLGIVIVVIIIVLIVMR